MHIHREAQIQQKTLPENKQKNSDHKQLVHRLEVIYQPYIDYEYGYGAVTWFPCKDLGSRFLGTLYTPSIYLYKEKNDFMNNQTSLTLCYAIEHGSLFDYVT